MSLSKEVQLESLLIDLEAVLRGMDCWDAEPPSVDALSSPEPFCVDTLEFYQWVQWIFIPRIYQDIAMGNSLPERCSIAALAEEWGKMRAFSARNLIVILQQVDQLLTAS